MGNIGRGSKVKFTFEVDGNSLGGSTLQDSNVDFKVDFYAIAHKGGSSDKLYTVNKTDSDKAFPDAEEQNIYYLICDTTDLDVGTICATAKITFVDEGTSQQLTEKMTLISDVVIEDMPESEDEEPQQEGEET